MSLTPPSPRPGRPQFYDMYSSFLKYFPGPHTKIYDILERMRVFIAERVKKNQETLDPNSPRDFIDCFLAQMEKVSGLHSCPNPGAWGC